MRGVILYFSGTGNTKYVSQLLKQSFEKQGCEMLSYCMEDSFELAPDTYDFLVLGFPKYYEYPPLKFIEFVLNKVPMMSTQTKTFIFCTQCGPTKVPAQKLTKILKQKNHTVELTSLFQLPNNFFLVKAFPPTPDLEIKIRHLNAKAKVEQLVPTFLNQAQHKESMGYVTDKFCEYFVAIYKHTIPRDVLKISTTSACTLCGLCQKHCPVQNIKMTEAGPKLNDQCMMCMRCLNHCPVNAFTYKGKTLPQYVNQKMKK
ncbi:MAG TPA: hypothetical protein DCY20_06385 [Firmicutes bacterium]|nr:hypothetical protein [Bacillota bacterium]